MTWEYVTFFRFLDTAVSKRYGGPEFMPPDLGLGAAPIFQGPLSPGTGGGGAPAAVYRLDPGIARLHPSGGSIQDSLGPRGATSAGPVGPTPADRESGRIRNAPAPAA